jgi:phage terminase large subunit
MQVVLPHNFTPRRYQAAVMKYFDEGGKRAFCAWHRRAGKDLCAIQQTGKMAHVKKGTYWHFFPTRAQAKRSIWEGHTKDGQRILELCFPGFLDPKRPASIVAKKNESDMSIELKCGSIWRLMGTDKTSFVGAGPQGVVFSEFAQSHPRAWDLVRPMLRESGGWAWFITTPRGRNHAFKVYQQAGKPESGWFCDSKTVYETGLTYASNKGDHQLSPDEMIEEEREEGMAEELIDQEYKVDWTAANIGSIYGKFLQKIEQRGELELAFAHPNDGVHTSWDLGISDSTAIWFWRLRADAVEFIDYYENHGQALEHYIDEVEERGYRYVRHWLPHDARARTLVTGTSVLEEAEKAFRERKCGAVAIGPELSLEDGISAGRWLLQRPDTRFHKRCEEGVEALRGYEYEYNEELKVFSKKPLHNWCSHGSDAFRGCAVVRKIALTMQAEPEAPPAVPKARPHHNSTSLDELWEANRPRVRERV